MIGAHAMARMQRRGISEDDVRAVLEVPGRIDRGYGGRIVLSSLRYYEREGRDYVLRVVVDVDGASGVVVTAYRTSKIDKYWNTP